MPDSAPLLSICIPTFNRAPFLESTLDSLTRQAVFQSSDEVEIVVSDNASTDGTARIIAAFREKYPAKITALAAKETTEANINFARVLESARGLCRKLHNDTLLVRDGFLEEFLLLIRENQAGRPVLFFLNGRNGKKVNAPLTPCRDLDAFIRHVSYFSTWIGSFSLWESDIPHYAPLFRRDAHHFVQTEILFSVLAASRTVVVYNPEFGESVDAPKALRAEHLKSVYFAEYLPLLRRAALEKHIRESVEQGEIRNFCFFYYVPWYHKLSGTGFSPSFFRDFRFIRDYAPTRVYYAACVFYLLFCLFGSTARRHKKLAWKIQRLFR